MIKIVNITENPKSCGSHHYILMIDDREICRFIHKREHGLVKCLMEAIEAYKAKIERDSEEIKKKFMNF